MKGLPAGILFIALLLAAPAQARYIYVYEDDQGKVHFSDYLSAVPPEYRSKARAKYIPDKKPKTVEEDKAGNAGGNKKSDGGSSQDEQAGLTKQQEQLMMESKEVLRRMIPLKEKYKDAPRDYANGLRMYQDIQGNLPIKQGLVEKLAGANHPLLLKVRGFLQGSIGIDKETGVSAGIPQHIASIYNRFASEAGQAASFIEQIDQAIEKSKKDKAEAEAQAKREAEKQSKK